MIETPLSQFFKSHRDAIVSLVLTLAAVAVRAKGLGLDGLWFDEVFSIRTVRLSVTEMIRLTSGDVHPPLYYLLLHFWTRCFGESESAVRMLSVYFSALTIFVVYHLALQLFTRRAAVFAALFVMLSPLHVYYAQEARMYGLFTFLAATSIYFFLGLLRDDERVSFGGVQAALYVIATALLLYTHIYAVFVVLAQLLYLAGLFFLARKTFQRHWRRWLVTQGLIGLLFLPWGLVILQQVRKANHAYWISEPDWLTPLRTLIEYSGSLGLALLLLALFVYGVRRFPRQAEETGNTTSPHLRALLLLWLILPISLPFLLSKIMTPFYLTKYTIAASLPFYLFAAWGLAQVRRVGWQAVLLSLICVCSGMELANDLTTLKRERWKDAAYNIEQAAQPGDLVLFNSTGTYLSFAYYAKRKDLNTAVFPYSATDDQPPSDLTLLQRAGAEGFAVHPPQTEAETKEKLQKLVGEHRHVWIVTRYGEGFKNDFVKAFGDTFRATAEPALCVSQRGFLFMEKYGETDSAIFLQRRGLGCTVQVYFLERQETMGDQRPVQGSNK